MVMNEWRIGFEMTQGQGSIESSTIVISPKNMPKRIIRAKFLKMLSKDGSCRLTNGMIHIGTCYVVGVKKVKLVEE